MNHRVRDKKTAVVKKANKTMVPNYEKRFSKWMRDPPILPGGRSLTLSGPQQSRFGDKLLRIRVVCRQNRIAVQKG